MAWLDAGFCTMCFTLSGSSGLYASQIIQFGKASALGNSWDFQG